MGTVGDNPGHRLVDDSLGREELATALAEELVGVDCSEGYVIAVMGPWGSGKTTLINFVCDELTKLDTQIPVVHFNPWMFSGTEQLVDSFLREIAAQLRVRDESRFKVIAENLDKYGTFLTPLGFVPVVGPWAGRLRTVISGVKKVADSRKTSISTLRDKTSSALAKLSKPIVVMIDDIDRLHPEEVRDIFKLVRLIANFPNIVYVLAFDRKRVEDSLTSTGLEGRGYLEKIVQLAIDLPLAPQELLMHQFTDAIDASLATLGVDIKLDKDRWSNVFIDVIWPLICNMRDVRRYTASLRVTAKLLASRVDLVDILAMEAIRLFLPDSFRIIQRASEALTKVYNGRKIPSDTAARSKSKLDEILEASGAKTSVASGLLRNLFPATQQHLTNVGLMNDFEKDWIVKKRVAHAEVLRLYLEGVPSDALIAHNKATEAYNLLSTPSAFEEFIARIPSDELQDVIPALEAYEGRFPTSVMDKNVAVLLNNLSRMSVRPGGLFALSPRLIVTRVVLRMLRQLSGQELLETVEKALQQTDSLSAKFELLLTVGYTENAGHKLIDEQAAQRLEKTLAEEVIRTPASGLRAEWNSIRLLWWARKEMQQTPAALQSDDAELNLSVLIQARTESVSQTEGSSQVTRTTNLAWSFLVETYGSEERLRQAVDSVRLVVIHDTEAMETLRLADKYLAGYRPKEFGED